MKPTTIPSCFRLRQGFGGQVLPAIAGMSVISNV